MTAAAGSRVPLNAAEHAAVAGWMAERTPERGPYVPTPRPRRHHGAPIQSFGEGMTVARETQHAAAAGACRIVIPLDCEIAPDGRVRRPPRPRGRKPKQGETK